MRRMGLVIAVALAAFAFQGCRAEPVVARTAPAPATFEPGPLGKAVRVWRPEPGAEQVPIWPGEAPDMADVPRNPESVFVAETPEALNGRRSEAVFDVTVPTMTIYPPVGENSGAAVVVFPGGGFQALAITLEGTEICHWLTAKGVTCVLLKYRVPGGNHHWDKACRCNVTPRVPRALQDAQRAIRLVRARAADLGVDPKKIGVMGFSAGGYLVAQTSNILEPTYAPVDAADRVSSRPDFAVAVYPGHLCRSGKFDPGIHVGSHTPPTFLLQAWDDPVDPVCNTTLYARALNLADVPSEAHLFARGGHAFGLRTGKGPLAVWPMLVEQWLGGLGVLEPPSPTRP